MSATTMTPINTTPILEVKAVSRYFGKFRALNNVSVSFQRR
jgi:ABC-type branched-subunit amino acid transport system ATPase component